MEHSKNESESSNDSKLLARIDERTQNLTNELASVKNLLINSYVTHDEFGPVKNLVYGMVSVILLSVLGALVALVIHGK